MAGLYLPASTLRSWPGAGGERAGQCRQRQGLIVPGNDSRRVVNVPGTVCPGACQRQRFDHGRVVPASVNASIMAGLVVTVPGIKFCLVGGGSKESLPRSIPRRFGFVPRKTGDKKLAKNQGKHGKKAGLPI